MKKHIEITLNSAENGYVVNGEPVFGKSFSKAMNFHFPEGAAAVQDNSGAYHINTEGFPIYRQRYLETYGYYGGIATVRDDYGYFHIDIYGNPVHAERYVWSGNFQEGYGVVKTKNGYCHIDRSGQPLYSQRYLYVGDFKYGIAVAHTPGGAIHIQRNGDPLNCAVYNDADLFHKGYAVVSGNDGYFHVNKEGKPLHSQRFLKAEPFYNGIARCITHDGRQVLLRENGFYTYVSQALSELTPYEISDLVSQGSKVAIFIRHGERPERPKGQWGNDLCLTPRGIKHAQELGSRLKGCTECSFHSSPIERCRQTAFALAKGMYGSDLPDEKLIHSTILGDPGPFNDNENRVHIAPDDFSKVSAIYLEQGTLKGFRPLSEACEHICAYLNDSLSKPLNIFSTHDFFVAGMERFLGLRHPKSGDWVDFLEGVCLVADGSGPVRWYILKGLEAC